LTTIVGKKSHAPNNFSTNGSFTPRASKGEPQQDQHEQEAAEIDALGRELDEEFNLFDRPQRRSASQEDYYGEYGEAPTPPGRRPEGVSHTAPKRVRGGRLGGPQEQFTGTDHRSQTVGYGAAYSARQTGTAKSGEKHWQKVHQSIANAKVHGRGGNQTSRLPAVGTQRGARGSPLKAGRAMTQAPMQPTAPSGAPNSYGGEGEGSGYTRERIETSGERKLALEEVV
jgi:hypothetical protein